MLDEIEKSHMDIHQLFLGLLDNGRMTSARGEQMDMRQCVVIMTTNAVTSKDIKGKAMGFTSSQTSPNPTALLAHQFPNEFLGRLDEIILFNSLTTAEMGIILKQKLAQGLNRFRAKGIVIHYEEESLLAELSQAIKADPAGVRGIIRLLERKVMQPLALAVLKSKKDKQMTLHLDPSFLSTGQISILKNQELKYVQ